MLNAVSPETVREYLPIIRAIRAELEIRTLNPDAVRARQKMEFFSVEGQYGARNTVSALGIMAPWAKAAGFAVDGYGFAKTSARSAWADLFRSVDRQTATLEKKLSSDAPPPIVLTFASGSIVRELDGRALSCPFEENGQKANIIRALPQDGAFLQQRELQSVVGAKSDKAVFSAIRKINLILANRLQLPTDRKPIEGKRGSGYRINPAFYKIRFE